MAKVAAKTRPASSSHGAPFRWERCPMPLPMGQSDISRWRVLLTGHAVLIPIKSVRVVGKTPQEDLRGLL